MSHNVISIKKAESYYSMVMTKALACVCVCVRVYACGCVCVCVCIMYCLNLAYQIHLSIASLDLNRPFLKQRFKSQLFTVADLKAGIPMR